MRMSRFYLFAAAALSGGGIPLTAVAQASMPDEAAYVRLEPAQELALARSAGPAQVSDGATLWLLRDGRYQEAVEGENGNHCFVMRSLPQSLEPICYDAEAAATAMRWEFRHFELRMAGKSRAEIDEIMAREIGAGELPVPTRPAMGYMLSSGQRLYNAESGRSAGNWKPHLMLYIPSLTLEDVGLSAATPNMFIFREGTPRAHLIMVVSEFVDPS